MSAAAKNLHRRRQQRPTAGLCANFQPYATNYGQHDRTIKNHRILRRLDQF